ncbi:MAG: ABC transporter substrate-binding protein [Betaproteobacteria bacterium]|nr:ABC transporter substrate-binding protein [Betaproteobacteria bacterium]
MLALGATPLAVIAQQQSRVWRIGFLGARRRPGPLAHDFLNAFPQGMRELGYVEGKNLVIEWRSADGTVERLPDLAAELVRLKVDVIVTSSTPTTSAAQKATSTIPIVMGTGGDPVGSGFVNSLARPGGNITGLTNIVEDLSPKQLEMLLSIAPKLSRVAVLLNPDNSSQAVVSRSVQAAAQKRSVKMLPAEARTPQEIEKAFSKMARENVGAVIVMPDPFLYQQRRQVIELAAKHRLPSIAWVREYVEAGGLMSYGSNFADMYRRAAAYVDKILKGAKPGDLPVEQPTKFEFVINRKTAKTLGLAIPRELLLRADELIE